MIVSAGERICNAFPITNEEYSELDKKYGKLVWTISHDLKRKNLLNNFLDDPEDVKQQLIIDMMKAGSYTKRQSYIEKSLEVVKKYVQDEFIKKIIKELEELWAKKTHHGASKQKYGDFQEKLLDNIVKRYVPIEEIPDKNAPLKFDSRFSRYCKSIVWNGQKAMGKKITKFKNLYNGMVSLSDNKFML